MSLRRSSRPASSRAGTRWGHASAVIGEPALDGHLPATYRDDASKRAGHIPSVQDILS